MKSLLSPEFMPTIAVLAAGTTRRGDRGTHATVQRPSSRAHRLAILGTVRLLRSRTPARDPVLWVILVGLLLAGGLGWHALASDGDEQPALLVACAVGLWLTGVVASVLETSSMRREEPDGEDDVPGNDS